MNSSRFRGLGQFDFAFLGVFVGAVNDGDVTDESGEVALGAVHDFLCEIFLLVFVIVEPYFEEFVGVEVCVDRANQGIGDALFPDDHQGFQVVGFASQVFSLCVGERGHVLLDVRRYGAILACCRDNRKEEYPDFRAATKVRALVIAGLYGLYVMIHVEFVRMRAQVKRLDFFFALVLNPRFDDVIGEDAAFEQELVVLV